MTKNKIVGIIPARLASQRFPGKLLVKILGKSLIQRTYDRASQCKSLSEIVIAADDLQIFNHVREFGAKVVMTQSHPTGSDRIAEVAEKYYPDADIVVNIQGDEPCLSPSVIDQLVVRLLEMPEACMTTAVTRITDPQEIQNPSVVKCVFDKNGRALYFSRSPIPYVRNGDRPINFYRHLGIYCFRRNFLLQYRNMPKTPLQELEDLEQLKILEHGFPIHVCVVEDQGIGVDTPEDIKKVEAFICQENTSSSQEALSLL